MDLKHILNEIARTDTARLKQVNDRRGLLKSFGSKVAVAALPLGLGSLFQAASAKTTATDTVIDALNYALMMEYFAYNFYRTGNRTGGLIPGQYQAGFQTVEDHKKAHIVYLVGVITGMSGTPYTPKNYDPNATNPYYIVSGAYDFTSGGKYSEASAVFTDFPSFVMMAEIFDDTLIHGYKGELPVVINDTTTLELMMKLQSATGRHAAHARYVRRLIGYAQAPEHPAPWISDNIPPSATFQTYYNGEDVVTQQGVDITGLSGATTGNVPHVSASAAFDEGYDKATVISLLAPFMIK